MRILSYSYKDDKPGWTFSNMGFRRVNLLVGATGSGKSKFLNSLWNVAEYIVQGGNLRAGQWDISFSASEKTYHWILHATSDGEQRIVKESLARVDESGVEHEIFVRDESLFQFGGQALPKLSKTSPGLYLLREEDDVQPAYASFRRFIRRNFFGSELQHACAMGNLPIELLTQVKTARGTAKDGLSYMLQTLPLGPRLFILRETSRDLYNSLVHQYRSAFPHVETIDFADGSNLVGAPAQGKVPILTIKERKVEMPIMLHDISSGMQKVLLIMADIISMPAGSLYVIDEYENSLGVNAINFLPAMLNEFGVESQFLITSHHPYLINAMPMSDWQVFLRSGSSVTIENGEKLAQRYGSSKQDSFIQLINDPAFLGVGA